MIFQFEINILDVYKDTTNIYVRTHDYGIGRLIGGQWPNLTIQILDMKHNKWSSKYVVLNRDEVVFVK